MPDGGSEVRLYSRTEIDPWAKNPRVGPLEVSDILATLTPERPRITEPLRLRLEPSGRYTALKGNRRLMAAAIRQIAEVPGILVTWSDDEALEEALVDEARKALTPLEEAQAFARLRQERGLDVPAIAARAGRSERHVRQRLVLVDVLSEEGRTLLSSRRISLNLALELATLSADAQALACREIQQRHGREVDGGEPLLPREVRFVLQEHRLRLVGCGFPIDDATLRPEAGLCTTCPKRSGVQAEMFADGIRDGDQCGDKACFAAKRSAWADRQRASAKEKGEHYITGAEAKKIFPYSSGHLPHGSPFVDLDEECNEVRPPVTERRSLDDKSRRRGGPEVCTEEVEGGEEPGEHAFDDCITEADQQPDHDAAKAGCSAWAECGCGAWQEELAEHEERGIPKDWKPPTWREALAQAKAAPPAPLKAEDPGGRVHELCDRKAAEKALRAAGLIRREEAREPAGRPTKKPGELDKHAIDRQAKQEATREARKLIAAKATKKAPDLKLWRLMAGLVLATDRLLDGDELEDAWRARAPAAEEKPAAPPKGKRAKPKPEPEEDPVEQLRGWVAKADEGEVRGLVVELLAEATYQKDSPFAIACRFFSVDVDALEAAARKRITDELKQKAKDKAAKEKGKAAKKTTKAPPETKASPAPKAEEPKAVEKLAEAETVALAGAERTAAEGRACPRCKAKAGKHCLGPKGKLGTGWFHVERTAAPPPEDAGPITAADVAALAKRHGSTPSPEASSPANLWACVTAIRAMPAGQLGRGDVDSVCQKLRTAHPVSGNCIAYALLYLVDAGDLRPPVGVGYFCFYWHGPIPITWEDVQRLAKPLKIEPHEGAQSPENVWGVVRRLRVRVWRDGVRDTLHRELESHGTHTVDIALAYLIGAGELQVVTKGKTRPGNDVFGLVEKPKDTPKACAVCGCTDSAACTDGKGECTWEKRGTADVCSVCVRACTAALGICQKKRARTLVVTALVTGGKGVESFDRPRATAVVKYLEAAAELGSTADGKLLAAQPQP